MQLLLEFEKRPSFNLDSKTESYNLVNNPTNLEKNLDVIFQFCLSDGQVVSLLRLILLAQKSAIMEWQTRLVFLTKYIIDLKEGVRFLFNLSLLCRININSKCRQNTGKALGDLCPRLPLSSGLRRVISEAESYLTTNHPASQPASQMWGLPFLCHPGGAW